MPNEAAKPATDPAAQTFTAAEVEAREKAARSDAAREALERENANLRAAAAEPQHGRPAATPTARTGPLHGLFREGGLSVLEARGAGARRSGRRFPHGARRDGQSCGRTPRPVRRCDQPGARRKHARADRGDQSGHRGRRRGVHSGNRRGQVPGEQGWRDQPRSGRSHSLGRLGLSGEASGARSVRRRRGSTGRTPGTGPAGDQKKLDNPAIQHFKKLYGIQEDDEIHEEPMDMAKELDAYVDWKQTMLQGEGYDPNQSRVSQIKTEAALRKRRVAATARA